MQLEQPHALGLAAGAICSFVMFQEREQASLKSPISSEGLSPQPREGTLAPLTRPAATQPQTPGTGESRGAGQVRPDSCSIVVGSWAGNAKLLKDSLG